MLRKNESMHGAMIRRMIFGRSNFIQTIQIQYRLVTLMKKTWSSKKEPLKANNEDEIEIR